MRVTSDLSTPNIMPQWLAPLGVPLAGALVTFGLCYLLLAPGLAAVMVVSGIVLVIFVSADGIFLHHNLNGIGPASE